MLRREERHHLVPWRVVAEIRHEMAEIVLLPSSNGAVGQEDVRIALGQSADSMIRIDPRIHSGCGVELSARRTQLSRDRRLECRE